METLDRIPVIIDALQKLWLNNPDLRLGQLLINIIESKDPCSELYHLEDTALLIRLLTAGITDENTHEETDYGPYIGRERLDDDEFDCVIEKAVKAMGEEVRELMEARRAKGLPDPEYDLSPARQDEVVAKLEEEMSKLRLHRERFLFGESKEKGP